ncbi:MAG: hypothetical protein R3B45_18460 [Bdellovibrionota bacterium]
MKISNSLAIQVEGEKSKLSTQLISGIITGQLAGLIMAVVVMAVFAIFLGKSPLFPVQVIGSTIVGESALHGFHFGALLLGLILHQAGPSLLWGTVYGLIASKLSEVENLKALQIGIGVGLVSMVGPYFLIPLVMKSLHGVDFWNQEVPMFWDWAAHLVFGASFALYPTVFKKLRS